jgi:hypothetical protein
MDFPSVRLAVRCSILVFSTEHTSTWAAGTADQRSDEGLTGATYDVDGGQQLVGG